MILHARDCRVYFRGIPKVVFCAVVATIVAANPSLKGQGGTRPIAAPSTRLETTRLHSTYREPSGHEIRLNPAGVPGLTLATADFNRDGYPDLVAGCGRV